MSQISVDWNNASKDYGTVRFGGDEDLVVLFYWKSVMDVQKSRDSGTPIYHDVEYVEIYRPGELMNKVVRPVSPEDKRRFPRQWQQFEMNKTQTPEGTPIAILFPNNPAISDNLRALGCYTIQQLANLTAHAIDSIGMGGQDWVNKAKEYLKQTADGKGIVKMQAEMSKMKADMDFLQKQNKELIDSIKVLQHQAANPTPINPATGMPNPAYVPGYDAQAERIDTKGGEARAEITKKFKAKAPITVEDTE